MKLKMKIKTFKINQSYDTIVYTKQFCKLPVPYSIMVICFREKFIFGNRTGKFVSYRLFGEVVPFIWERFFILRVLLTSY